LDSASSVSGMAISAGDLRADNFVSNGDAELSLSSPSSITLHAGQTSNSLGVLVDTSSAGVKAGTVSLDLTSIGEVRGTTIEGLGETSLVSDSVQVVAQVNEFANAAVAMLSGDGTMTLSQEHEYFLDFGTVEQGDGIFAELGLLNDVLAPADELAGDFQISGPAFSFINFGSFSDLLAGDQLDSLIVDFDTSAVGSFSGQIWLDPRSENSSGFSGLQNQISINVTGNVVAIAEPAPSALLLLVGTIVAVRSRRR